MGKRQRQWAKRARRQLIDQLGGRCVDCGTTDDLQLDHKYQRTWKCRELDTSRKVAMYRREAARGLLEVRCGTCNRKKGRPEKPEPSAPGGQRLLWIPPETA